MAGVNRQPWCLPTPARIHQEPGQANTPLWFIPLLTQHYAMLQRNLVYTASPAAKQLVVLVGRRRHAMAVEEPPGPPAYTKLGGVGLS